MSLTFHSLGTDARPYVLGLRWRDLGELSDLKQLVADQGGHGGVVLDAGDRTTVGIAVAEKGSKQSALGKTSAAALLALSQPNERIAFATSVGDGRLWVVSVLNGSVDDRTDVVVDAEAAERIISDLLTDSADAGNPLQILLSNAEALANHARWYRTADLSKSFSSLIDSGHASRARVRALGPVLNLTRVLFWLVVLGVAGGMGWYELQRRQSGATDGGSAPAMDPVEAERLRSERIISVVSQALQQDGFTPAIAPLLQACGERLMTVTDGFTAGWIGSKGSCDAGAVQVIFQRGGQWALIGKGVAAGREQGAQVTFGPADTTLNWQWPIQSDSRKLPAGLPATSLLDLQAWLEQLPTHASVLTTYYTAAQRVQVAYGDQAQISAPVPKGLVYEDPEASAAQGQAVLVPVPAEYSYQVATITLMTLALPRLDGLIAKAAPHWWISLERVEANPAPHGWRYSVKLKVLVR